MESSNSRIDVDELMERIRADVARRGVSSPQQRTPKTTTIARQTRPTKLQPELSSFLEWAPVDLGADRLATLHDLLERARQTTEVGTRIPKLFRQVFRNQKIYNSLLIQSVIPLFETLLKFIGWQEKLLNELRAQNSRFVTHIRALRDAGAQDGRDIANLQSEAGEVQARIKQLEHNLEARMKQLEHSLDETRQIALRTEERQSSEAAFLKSELHLMDRRISEGKDQLEQPIQPTAGSTADHKLDGVYAAFENRFRGSRQLIKDRLRVYIQDVKEAGLGVTDPMLDLGCGRGEWLEIAAENQLVAEGVDSNAIMANECRERGLKVTEGDALQYLRSLPVGSRGVITAFHLIEHLDFGCLVELCRETFRVLRPNGMVIFETPNPDNVLVGSSRFYTDPTHRHPLPGEVSQFLLQSAGFHSVVIRPLHPDAHQLSEDSASPEMRHLLNRLFFSEQDYAVIGRKQPA